MLIEMQRDFRTWLQRGEQSSADRIGRDAQAGLRMYRNNHRGSLFACLEETFERTRQWIGDDAFRDAVAAHIERVPPSSWTLDAYPRDLPATLGALYPDDPEVEEIAAIELALSEAFVAADSEPLAIDTLGAVDWDNAVLVFTPSLDLLPAWTNAAEIWAAMADGSVPPRATPSPDGQAVLVWRQEEVSRLRSIDGDEHHALRIARAGRPFSGLCKALVEFADDEQAGIELAGKFLGRWLADGLIIRIEGEEPCVL
jgi:hypothetical protein